MIKTIELLPENQQEILYDAIPYVTLLIAGADGNIDPKELEWSEKITEIRSFSFHNHWQDYYERVHAQLNNRIQALLKALPSDTAERQEIISNRLSELNDILPHFDTIDAKLFYDGLLSFAERIAKADGGLMGWFSIDAREKAVIGLPMIHPIEL
jgi:hypothetical protein